MDTLNQSVAENLLTQNYRDEKIKGLAPEGRSPWTGSVRCPIAACTPCPPEKAWWMLPAHPSRRDFALDGC